MPLELINESKNFEIVHPSGAVFILKEWVFSMQDQLEKACIVQDGRGNIQYLTSKDREMKIDLCLVGWRGVTLDGVEVECNAENKRKLPVGVAIWLVKEIDERSGMRMREEEKKT